MYTVYRLDFFGVPYAVTSRYFNANEKKGVGDSERTH